MAGRFGATIIPFGAIGAYDSVNMIADSQELRKLPWLGPWLEQQIRDVPKARDGMGTNPGAADEVFVPPLTAPGVPSRFYFLFGEPVETEGEDMEVRGGEGGGRGVCWMGEMLCCVGPLVM